MATMLKTINWQFSLGTANLFFPPPSKIYSFLPSSHFVIRNFNIHSFCYVWHLVPTVRFASLLSAAPFLFSTDSFVIWMLEFSSISLRIHFLYLISSSCFVYFTFFFFFPSASMWSNDPFFFFFFQILFLFFNIYFAFPHAL